MTRYKLIMEYDGTPFVGWQRQAEDLSVQQALEEAAKALDGHKVTAFAAGRTDAGVHALGMACHIDLTKDLPADTVRDALNHHLKPHPAAVLSACKVSTEFHARFSCTARHYLYRLISRKAPLTLDRKELWRVPYELDEGEMHEAAQYLVGRHDFTTFRSVQCQSQSPVKTVDEIVVRRVRGEIHIKCTARSFLHNQVRSFVGTLERVGAGRWEKGDVKKALEAKNRAACGPVAPPHGLYFVKADYPPAL